MQIHILQVVDQNKYRSNKDTNGGYGTVNDFGSGLIPGLLKNLKRSSMNYPELLPAYLIAVLRRRGHILSYGINTMNPDAELVLIQTSIIHFTKELEWADRIRRDFPSVKIGFVGGMSSGNPELYMAHGDFVVQGEAENVFMNTNPAELSGLVLGGQRDELDDLPFPDWSHIRKEDYQYRLFLIRARGRFLPVQASRGCPMSCSYYCTYPLVQGSKFRPRSPENVVAEIEYLQQNYQVNSVIFRDPIFSFDMRRAEEICSLLIEKGIKLRWVCETHPRFLTEHLIELMEASGCTAVKLGIESGNLNVMQKSHRSAPDLQYQKAVIRQLEKNKINVLAFYILGYYSDTCETIQQTIRYAQELNTYGAQFTIATPYPGTAWYRDLHNQDQSFLDPKLENYSQYRLVFAHPHLTFNELENLKSSAYQRYYLRWSFIRKNLLRI